MATVAEDGRPTARSMTLRYVDDQGFVFYTDYTSSKGRHVADDSRVALVFAWSGRRRQVRVEGRVCRVTPEESDRQFALEPRGVQERIVSLAQSSGLMDRHILEHTLRDFRKRHALDSIVRPASWGGYRVRPVVIEFWQERPDYLHDRVSYEFTTSGWKCRRLTP
jgi:pyridoxamine 5'-phosphate oxidase